MSGSHFETADIAIVGAGFAGSAAALVLARAGHRLSVIDPHRRYPADFRCEKLSPEQVRLAGRLGLRVAIRCQAREVCEVVVAHDGRPVDVRATRELCLSYDTMVNAVRDAWPGGVDFHEGRVAEIATSGDRQHLVLGNGRRIEARLVVLATGPGQKLRAALGMRRRMIRPDHSICVGFDMVTAGGKPLSPRALTYHGERAGDGVAFATFFPLGQATRCNLFGYFEPTSAIVTDLRRRPLETVFALLPGLRDVLGDVRVAGPPAIRITDLYRMEDHLRDGVVLIGDALHSSCPVTGTGVSRMLTDVEQLCSIHVPQWLATPGMSQAKIAAFYADERKQQVDRASAARAEHDRRHATDRSWTTHAWRLAALAKARAHFTWTGREPAALSYRTPEHAIAAAAPSISSRRGAPVAQDRAASIRLRSAGGRQG